MGYLNSRQPELAFKACLEGMNAEPDNEDLLMQFGFINMQQRNFGLARHVFGLIRDRRPNDFAVLHNLGLAEISCAPYSGEEKYLDIGDKNLRKALSKSEESYQSMNGIGQVYLHKGNWQACVEYCEKSLAINPNQAGLRETYGMALLAQGRLSQGFQNLDLHIPSLTRKPKPIASEPYWEGPRAKITPAGVIDFGPKERLFVQGEQGMGDEISFAGLVPAAARDCQVLLECDPRLEGLFKRSFPEVRVEGTRNRDRDWEFTADGMCLSGSLCTHYFKEESDFPRKGFLKADYERQIQWRALLQNLPGKKIGIAWKGGVPMNFASRRSLQLTNLLPILRLKGVTWVSLEYKDPTEEIEHFRRRNPDVHIVHWPRAVGKGVDYDETAALVSELDGVVSVCTSVIHLCGALGKKAHVLVPKVPRWFYESKDSKHRWYDSLTLHRETDKGWPVDAVRQALIDAKLGEG